MDSFTLLNTFLRFPLCSSDALFEKFEELPGAIAGKGSQSLERFVYVPGNRKDRVVLVAHADTVWDQAYGYGREGSVVFENGVFRSDRDDCGIGADDRAGCAMLWALRDQGHSLLLLNGEEKGKIGANYLKKQYPALYRQLNKHQFMMEFDWAGTGGCLYNQVDNTQKFKDHIRQVLGFQDSQEKGGCDLQILCKQICGVNVAVGWHNCHSPAETLDLEEWERTYRAVTDFLRKPQPRFKTALRRRIKKQLQAVKRSVMGTGKR